MALVNVAGRTAKVKYTLTATAGRLAGLTGVRMATLDGHAPGRTDAELGVLCGPCSPSRSRVVWPCWTYRRAADGLVTGLLS